MIIKSSTSLRNDYTTISKLAHQEPVYITKNGEGDIVVMSIEIFEKIKDMSSLRSRICQAEQSRQNGNRTYSLEELEQEFLSDENL